MKSKIVAVILFALSIKAQYSPPIPCQSDNTCRNVLISPQNSICISSVCMCANATTKLYQYCSNKDLIVNARYAGLKRDCSGDVDCEHIEGAKCYNEQGDRSKGICDCRPHMLMSTDVQRCLPVVTEPLARCTESIQCTAGLDGAECVDGLCRCRTNFHYASSQKRCILNKVFGEKCTREEESCFQLAEPHNKNALGCSNKNVCKCLKDYIYVNGLCQHSEASRIVIQLSLVVIMVISTIKMF